VLMKRLLFLLVGIAIFAGSASAQTLDDYLKLRKHYGITQAVGVEALETLVGSRVVEVQGVVKGSVTVEGRSTLLLQKSNNDTMYVKCPGFAPDWLSSNEVPVRLIIEARRESSLNEIFADLLGAAPEGDIAAIEARERARTTIKTSRHAMRVAHEASSVSANEAVPIYAGFIMQRNHRLSEAEAMRIAQGVIGYSLRYGVDARLIMAMVMVESGFNPYATSRTGAMGLGQLMPGTAAGMGVSHAYDSVENLYGTVRLIRNHLDNYQRKTGEEYSSLVLALAAYNAGAGAVSRHGGVPPYRETQNYVRKVIGIYRALCGA